LPSPEKEERERKNSFGRKEESFFSSWERKNLKTRNQGIDEVASSFACRRKKGGRGKGLSCTENNPSIFYRKRGNLRQGKGEKENHLRR